MTQDELIGKQLDEYQLESLLGQGGMARVYRAMDVRLGRYVAIKVIDPPLRTDSDYVMRFEREAQAIARLEHPHIIRLYRYGEVDGMLYMAMQYVEGASLQFLLDSYREDGKFMEPDEANRIIREICLALDYAHGKGVIHRDIKPSNIMLDRQGHALLTDFGLALMTEVGTRGEIFGSPHYIAPEQAISSAGAVPQSDFYSLGVILYEMFTGKVPFDADAPLDIASLHMSASPPLPSQHRPEISPALEAVMLKALSKEPADRFPNGKALADALEQTLRPISAQQPLSAQRTILHRSIPERVEAELIDNPLPPIPAAVAAPPAMPELVPVMPPVSTSGMTPSKRKRKSPIACMGLIIVGAVAMAALATAAALLLGRPGILAQQNPPLTMTALQVSLSETPVAETMPAETQALAVTDLPTDVPTPTPQESPEYELLIVTRGEDSLFVINLSPVPFPLGPLRLGDGGGAIDGSQWGIEMLQSGQCVTVWKQSGNPRAADNDCERVGTRLTRAGPERFWKSTFSVYYADAPVGICQESAARCEISIPAN